MAGMQSIRSDCPGPHQPGPGVKSWALALFCSSVKKCSVKSRGQTQRLSSCPSLGGHCCSSGLTACGTSHHRSVAAQQTEDPVMTWRCVRPSKELNLLPVHSKESWNSPVGLYPDTGLWHIFSSGTLSAVCYLNGQPLRNTNAEMLHRQRWLKKFARTLLNCPCTRSSHVCGKIYWLYTEVPAPTAHLCCTICPHGAGHIPSNCQSSMESSSQPPLRTKGLKSANPSLTLLSNYFYQTTFIKLLY